jgi:exonuclease VII large subunit
LERGYSLVQTIPDGKVVKSSATLQVGNRVKIRFAQGGTVCRIEEKE